MRKIKKEELNRISCDAFKQAKKTGVCIVLDGVRSAMNVGSAFRTGDAFLIEKIYLCGITATPPHKEINKTALGAQHSVEWVYSDNTSAAVEQLKAKGYTVIAVEQADESTSLLSFAPEANEAYAFIFGNEVFGVSDEVIAQADTVLEIPQYGTKHSLNIAVSMGVVLWDYTAKTANEKKLR